jgi:hypothetical protein
MADGASILASVVGYWDNGERIRENPTKTIVPMTADISTP